MVCRVCGSIFTAEGGTRCICPDCAVNDPTLTLWIDSIGSGTTAEDSIRSPRNSLLLTDPESLPFRRLHRETTGSSDKPSDYTLGERLGSGGMGDVFSASQTSFRRPVAIKMAKSKQPEERAKTDALLAEAVVTGNLDHPNVVPVHDLCTDDEGNVFFVMKKVQGSPWSQVMSDKSLDENLDILLRVADAIAYAHSKGILHRDLKPHNIMIGEFGEIMVMDWGASCAFRSNAAAGIRSAESSFCGTPAYMPPEMASGDVNRIGQATDVYLLGALLYHILTGHPPRFEKDPVHCLSLATENHIEPFDQAGELQRIAMKAMATVPADRYSDVKSFQAAVRNYRMHSEVHKLIELAKESLIKARVNQKYEMFNRAIYGFRQAAELWPEHPDAQRLKDEASLDYARCALTNNDLELAQSLLDPENSDHTKLLELIQQAFIDRDVHKKRSRRLRFTVCLLLALLGIFFAVSFFLIREKEQLALEENRKGLINLISAHYGEQNYDAVMDTFWKLSDRFGIEDLDQRTLLEVRKAAFINPFRGRINTLVKQPLAIQKSMEEGCFWIVGCNEAVKIEIDLSQRYVPGSLMSIYDYEFGRHFLGNRTIQHVKFPAPISHAYAFQETGEDMLWIGSGSCLYRFDSEDEEWSLVLALDGMLFPDLPEEYELDEQTMQDALGWMNAEGRTQPITGLMLTKDQSRAAVALGGNLVAWIDVEHARPLGWFSGNLMGLEGETAAIAPLLRISPDERWLVYRNGLSSQPHVHLMALDDFRQTAYYYGRDYNILDIVFPDDWRFVAINQDGLIFSPHTSHADTFGPFLPDDTNRWFPEHWATRNLSQWNGALASLSQSGMRCAVLSAESELFVGSSIEGAGYDLSRKIISRSYTDGLLDASGHVLLLTDSGELCVYQMNRLAVCNLELPGAILDLCPANTADTLFVLLKRDDGTRDILEIASVDTERPQITRLLSDAELQGIECSPVDRLIAGDYNGSSCLIIDGNTGEVVRRLATGTEAAKKSEFSWDGRYLSVGGLWSPEARVFRTSDWQECFTYVEKGTTALGVIPDSGGIMTVQGIGWDVAGYPSSEADGVFSKNASWRLKSEGTALTIIPYEDHQNAEPRFWIRSWFDRYRSYLTDNPSGEAVKQDYWFKRGFRPPQFEHDCDLVALPKVNQQLELALKSDMYPVCDSLLFGAGVGSVAFTREGASLAYSTHDGLTLVNLSDELVFNRMSHEKSHFVSKSGLGIWPYATLMNASTDLQKAIEIAQPGSTVVLDRGEYILLDELVLRGKRDFKIVGAHGALNTKIIQQGDGHVFNVNSCSGTLTLEGLSITGGNAVPNGGAIGLYNSEHLHITNCIIAGNRAQRFGGVLHMRVPSGRTGSLTISDSVFDGNAAIEHNGGAISVTSETNALLAITLNRCSFLNNSAGDSGGALKILFKGETESSLHLRDCIFEGNTAGKRGGAIITSSRTGNVRVMDSSFINNRAGKSGGAIISTATNEAFLISGCEFVNNTAGGQIDHVDGGTVTNCVMSH